MLFEGPADFQGISHDDVPNEHPYVPHGRYGHRPGEFGGDTSGVGFGHNESPDNTFSEELSDVFGVELGSDVPYSELFEASPVLSLIEDWAEKLGMSDSSIGSSSAETELTFPRETIEYENEDGSFKGTVAKMHRQAQEEALSLVNEGLLTENEAILYTLGLIEDATNTAFDTLKEMAGDESLEADLHLLSASFLLSEAFAVATDRSKTALLEALQDATLESGDFILPSVRDIYEHGRWQKEFLNRVKWETRAASGMRVLSLAIGIGSDIGSLVDSFNPENSPMHGARSAAYENNDSSQYFWRDVYSVAGAGLEQPSHTEAVAEEQPNHVYQMTPEAMTHFMGEVQDALWDLPDIHVDSSLAGANATVYERADETEYVNVDAMFDFLEVDSTHEPEEQTRFTLSVHRDYTSERGLNADLGLGIDLDTFEEHTYDIEELMEIYDAADAQDFFTEDEDNRFRAGVAGEAGQITEILTTLVTNDYAREGAFESLDALEGETKVMAYVSLMAEIESEVARLKGTLGITNETDEGFDTITTYEKNGVEQAIHTSFRNGVEIGDDGDNNQTAEHRDTKSGIFVAWVTDVDGTRRVEVFSTDDPRGPHGEEGENYWDSSDDLEEAYEKGVRSGTYARWLPKGTGGITVTVVGQEESEPEQIPTIIPDFTIPETTPEPESSDKPPVEIIPKSEDPKENIHNIAKIKLNQNNGHGQNVIVLPDGTIFKADLSNNGQGKWRQLAEQLAELAGMDVEFNEWSNKYLDGIDFSVDPDIHPSQANKQTDPAPTFSNEAAGFIPEGTAIGDLDVNIVQDALNNNDSGSEQNSSGDEEPKNRGQENKEDKEKEKTNNGKND